MSATAISDTSRSLIALLHRHPQVAVPDASIAAASPKVATDLNLRLSLFLYKVVESGYLKNEDRHVLPPPAPGARPRLQHPPLYLDLHYLLTAYPPGDGQQPAADLEAHELLGRAMGVLSDNGVLSAGRLRGGLSGTDAEIRVTLNPITMEDMTRIWSVLPDTPYRISVAYLVTPVPVASTLAGDSEPVVDRSTDHGQRREPEPSPA